MSYERDIRINPDDLDESWLEQAPLFLQYSDALAAAEKQLNDVKEELTVLEATAFKNILDNESKKPSDSVMNSMVSLDSNVMEKRKEVNQLKFDVGVLKGVVEAFNHRKKALEKLVDLRIYGLNAEPKQDRIRETKKRKNES